MSPVMIPWMHRTAPGPMTSTSWTPASATSAPERMASACVSGTSALLTTYGAGTSGAGGPGFCSAVIKPRGGVRLVEQFHRVHHADPAPRRPEPRADLHHATGVAGGDDVGPRRQERLGLPREDGARELRLQERVDPRAAAAQLRLGVLHALEPGDRIEHRERRVCDALRVN